MPLQSQLASLISAIGLDVKNLDLRLDTLESIGPSARDLRAAFQSYWSAVVAGGTAGTNFNITPTFVGTATAATYSVVTRYQSLRRVEYLVTTAATTAIASARSNLMMARGTVGQGGYKARLRTGPATGTTVTTGRFFLGIRGSAATPTDVDPSTLANIIGLGWDSADTNVQLMHNDGSGVATKVDLGASFPVPTTDRSVMYELILDCPAGASAIAWQVREIVGNATQSGSISTDQPGATTTMSIQSYHSVGGTSSVVGLAVMDFYVETPEV